MINVQLYTPEPHSPFLLVHGDQKACLEERFHELQQHPSWCGHSAPPSWWQVEVRDGSGTVRMLLRQGREWFMTGVVEKQ